MSTGIRHDGPPATEIVAEQNAGAISITHLRYAGADDEPVPAALFRRRDANGMRPAVVIQHGANTSKEDFYVQAPARRWANEGWTVLAIDLAEHGERVVGEPLPPLERRKLITRPPFVDRSLVDLRRGLDVLATTPGVDAERLGFVGFSLGGMLGTVFSAGEPRIRAVAIVIAGSFAYLRYWERGDSDARQRRLANAHATDPAFFAAAIAPRPFLMVNTEDDPVFPREAVLTLFDAAREPKELRWHPGTHHQWGSGVYKDVWQFLVRELDDGAGR